MVGRLRTGTSGYQYPHWRDVVYPAGLAKADWFRWYCTHFNTVEINNTFYRLPDKTVFQRWSRVAPDDFLYALKFSQYGSHRKKLASPEETIGLFTAAASELGDRLGPVLVQLPPHWRCNLERLRYFLECWPSSVRVAVEFRDASWLNDEVFACLADAGAALCIHDMIENHPRVVTTDWVYLRYHGGDYTGRYTPQALTAQARLIHAWLENGDVFAYFNNDYAGHAFHNALQLKRYVANAG